MQYIAWDRNRQIIKSLAACFCVYVCTHGYWGPNISKTVKRLEVRFQWDTNRKWHMVDRLVTWQMSRDPERSRSWPQYVWLHYLENGWR